MSFLMISLQAKISKNKLLRFIISNYVLSQFILHLAARLGSMLLPPFFFLNLKLRKEIATYFFIKKNSILIH